MGGPSQSAATGALTAGVDIGTTAVKAVVVDEDGQILRRSRLASSLHIGPGGRFEHDATSSWWDSPRAALRQAVAATEAPRLRGVAVSAMMPSVAPVDQGGRPIGPGLLYGDARASTPDPSAASAEASTDPTTSEVTARLSAWLAGRFPGAAGYWPALAVANASLGGEGATDLASAFAAGPLFGPSGWDEAVCQAAGFPASRLPRVAVFGEAIGTVETDVLSGGPGPVPGADVVLGAGSVDGFCEQLVAGTAEDGDVLVALGSTLVVWMTVPGWPAEVPGLWRAPHLVAGKAMLGGASNAGGMWADWADRALRPPPAGPSAGGGDEDGPDQVPLWWPWANGERVPWHDRSLRIAMSGADLSFGPGPLRRGVYEATGFVVRHIVERAARCGTTPQRFIVSGGGMANPDWVQALADVLGQAVLPMAVPEGAALGAAFLARMAAGLESSLDDARRWARWSAEVEPRPAWAQAANQRYQRWRESLPGAE